VATGFRSITKSPFLSLVAILTLTLGIGATTAVFSVAEAVLFRALPYAEPDRLVVALYGGENPVSPADYYQWKEENSIFAGMSAAEYWTPNWTARDHPMQIDALRVSDNLFELLGVGPALGRVFTESEERPEGALTVVLSDKLWRSQFAGDRNVIGRELILDGRSYTVVAVMPRGFEFPLFWATKAELWAPLPLGNRKTSNDQSLRVFARLQPGITINGAQSAMNAIIARAQLEGSRPRSSAQLQILPFQDKVTGDVKESLIILLCAVGFVLLIACANVANLLLTHGTGRRSEMAVRTAVGATRGTLIRQLLVENGWLAFFGAIGGLTLAYGTLSLIIPRLPDGILPRQGAISIDNSVLLFVLLLSIASTLLFGLLPAIHGSRTDLNDVLKETIRSSGDRRTQWRRRVLAASEIAIAVVLLTGAGLMIRSLIRLQSVDPGFTTENLLTMTFSLAGTKEAAINRSRFYSEVVDQVKSLAGVQSASLINHLPLAGDIWVFPFTVEGQAVANTDNQPAAAYRVVYPGYFETMQIMVRGRDFTVHDTETSPEVVIVNEAMAQRYFSGKDVVGKRIRIGGAASTSPWLTIVGVVPTIKQKGWTDKVGSEMYLPLLQTRTLLSNAAPHYAYMTLVVRGESNVSRLASAIRNEIWNLEPNAPISNVATMEEVVSEQISRPRAGALLLTTFALAGLTLAVIGIYSVMSYSVSLRSREIVVRTALGAEPQDVFNLIIREGMTLALVGITSGLALSWALGRLMQTILYQVSPSDPVTLISVTALLSVVAFLACVIPARRALRIDSVSALR
jgi:predicted permease